MRDYIKEIAEKLENQRSVIFYTVGSVTFESINELKHRFGLLPTAVCDGDPKKQGRTYKGLEGIKVISPEEALEIFPQGEFYICSLDYKYQIIGFLTEQCDMDPKRIINYVPVEKIRSCSFLQKALIYDRSGIMRFCWRNPCPSIMESRELEATELLKLRNCLIEEIKNGKTPSHAACLNCPQIGETYYPKEPMSWSVNYFCQSKCNYNCSYCTVSSARAEQVREDAGRHTLGEVISAFKEQKMLSDSYSVILSTAGEPLLHPKRQEFYQAFDGTELVINTNGSIWDEKLFELMNREKVLLDVSLDAGTAETYAKIKNVGLKALDAVKKNLSAYAKAKVGIVALKYLFVPGINDQQEDVDGFVQICEEVGAVFVIVAVDYFSKENITEQTKNAIRSLGKKLSEKNILCVPYTAWETMEYSKMIKNLVYGED